jgi:RNA polymerase sigma-70 factor (ECF subfamily)
MVESAGDSVPSVQSGIKSAKGRPSNGRLQSNPAGLDPGAGKKSDEMLVALFQSGETAVFRVLVERYQERIRNLIFTIVRDRNAVDDLAQEVFIKAYQGLPDFRFQSSVYTWVYRIAINRSRDELRRRKIKRFFSLDRSEGIAESSESLKSELRLRDPGMQDLVSKALDSMPEKYRLPVILKDVEEMSYEEIAATMGCEIGTVKSRLSRGRAMLRSVLKPLLDNE